MDSTNRPKPHPPIKKTEAPKSEETSTEVVKVQVEQLGTGMTTTVKVPDKKPFKLTEHLTERPFKHHEGLQQLKESIGEKQADEKPRPRYSGNKAHVKRTPRAKRSK
jgi:hypothetical protein